MLDSLHRRVGDHDWKHAALHGPIVCEIVSSQRRTHGKNNATTVLPIYSSELCNTYDEVLCFSQNQELHHSHTYSPDFD